MTRWSLEAADGAVLYLAPGTHVGQIQAEGKSLTIVGEPEGATILSGRGLQTPVYVGAGGEVRIKDIRIAPDGAGSLAAFVQGGRLLIAGGRIDDAPDTGLYAEQGELLLLDTEIARTATDALVALNGSRVALFDSRVRRSGRFALAAQGARGVVLENTEIDGAGDVAILVQGGGNVILNSVAVTDVRGDGFSLDGGSAEIAGTAFSGLGRYGIVLGNGANANVIESSFTDVADTAIVAQQAGSVILNAIDAVDVGAFVYASGSSQLGLFGTRAQARATDSPLVQIGEVGRARIVSTILSGGRFGLYVERTSVIEPVIVSDSVVHGASEGGIYLNSNASVSGSTIAGNNGFAFYVDTARTLELNGSTVVGDDSAAIRIQDLASVYGEENVLLAAAPFDLWPAAQLGLRGGLAAGADMPSFEGLDPSLDVRRLAALVDPEVRASLRASADPIRVSGDGGAGLDVARIAELAANLARDIARQREALGGYDIGSGRPARTSTAIVSPLPVGGDNPAALHKSLVSYDAQPRPDYVDFALPAPNLALAVTRHFYHGGADRGFGPGWQWNMGLSVEFDANGYGLQFIGAGGGPVRYEWKDDILVPSGGGPGPFFTVERGLPGPVTRHLPGGAWEKFDPRGRLVARGGPGGLGHVLIYDGNGRLAAIKDVLNRVFSFSWADGRISEVRDPAGRTRAYSYDDKGRLVSVRYDTETVAGYAYRPDDRLAEIRFPEGGVVDFSYDDNGVLTAVDGPGRLATRVEYAADFIGGSRLKMTDAVGRSVSSVMQGGEAASVSVSAAGTSLTAMFAGKFVELANPNGGKVSIERGAAGGVAALSDADGDMMPAGEPLPIGTRYDSRGYPAGVETVEGLVETAYDDLGRLADIAYADGTTESFVYDDLDRVIAWVDTAGGLNELRYDRDGRLVSMTGPENELARYVYDDIGMLSESTEAGYTATFDHDAAGQLVSMRDIDGDWRFSYDAAGRMTGATTAEGTTLFEYDGTLLTSVTEPDGRTLSTIFDSQGRPVEVSDGEGPVLTLAHGASGDVTATDVTGAETTTISNPDGGTTMIYRTPLGRSDTVELDPVGRPVKRTDTHGGDWAWTYDEAGRLTEETSPMGRTQFVHDTDGRLVALTHPDGEIESLVYDAAGNVVEVASSRGDRLVSVYDSAGNIVEIRNARGRIETLTYDDEGRIVSRRDGGVETRYRYDADGQLQEVQRDGQGPTTYAYDEFGRVVRVEFRRGETAHWVAYAYGAGGDLVSIDGSDGYAAAFTYDDIGRLVRHVENGAAMDFTYDVAGNLVSQIVDGVETKMTYDADGRRTSTSGPAGTVAFGYGTSDAVVSMTLPDGGVWTYERDAAGRVLEIVDPLGGETAIHRSSYGAVVRIIDPDGREISIERDDTGRISGYSAGGFPLRQHIYDAFGDVAAIRFADGSEISFERNDLGELTAVLAGEDATIDIARDSMGRLATARGPARESTFEYDSGGRIVAESGDGGLELRYRYDGEGRRSRLTATGGVDVSYAYDESGRLGALTGRMPAEFLYDLHGRPSGASMAETRLTIEYNAAGQKASVALNGRPVLAYRRDANGAIVGLELGANATAFAYDARGRLVSAGTDRFVYDGSGNALQFAHLTGLEYDSANRLVRVGGEDARHDGAGRIDTVPGLVEAAYDGFGQVVWARGPDGAAATYAYDYRGRMVERSVDGTTIRYLYDGDDPLAAYDESGALLAWLERGPAGSDIGRFHVGGDTYFVVWGEMDVPLALIDEDGEAQFSAADPWGRDMTFARLSYGLLGFGGAVADPVTGLVFMRARTYLPALGRFLQPDPLGPGGGLNMYAFAEADPLGSIDIRGTNVVDVPFSGPFPAPQFPDTPASSAVPASDIGVHQNWAKRQVMADLRKIMRSHPDAMTRQIARETLDLVRNDHVFPNFGGRHPKYKSYYGMVDPNNPRVAEIFVDKTRAKVNEVAGRMGNGRGPTLTRALSGLLTHEATHSVQYHRGLNANAENFVVRELEARLRHYKIDPWMAGVGPGPGARPNEIISATLRNAHQFGRPTDVLTERGMRNLLREYFPDMSDRQIAREIRAAQQSFRNHLANAPQGRPARGNPFATSSGRPPAGNLRGAQARPPPRGFFGRAGLGALRIGGGALAAYSQYVGVQEVISGRRSIPRFMFDTALNGITLYEAMAGRALLGPLGWALMAQSAGQLLGNLAAYYAIQAMNDPTDPYGHLLRYLLNVKVEDRFPHPCGRAINCDCESIEAGILTIEWRKDCRRCQLSLRTACYNAYNANASTTIEEAVGAAGSCTGGCSVHGPNARP